MSSYKSGIAKLIAGRGASVFFGLISAPIIARLFTPANFGVVGILESIAGWIGAFACLGYAQAIPISKDRDETRRLVWLCLFITFFLFLIVFSGTYTYSFFFEDILLVKKMDTIVWFIPVFFVLASVSRIAEYTLAKEKMFGILSIVNFSSANISRIIQILLGLIIGGSAGFLLMGQAIGFLAGVAIAFIPLIKKLFIDQNISYQRREVIQLAKQYKQFPKYQIWNNSLNMASQQFPILIMAYFFSYEDVGCFVFSKKFLAIPMFLLGSSISQAFYPHAAEEWKKTSSMSESIKETTKLLSLTCTFPIVAVTMLGPLFFVTAFGTNWYLAGIFSMIIAPSLLINLFVSPLTAVFLITNRAKHLLLFTLALLIFRCGGMIGGGMLEEPMITLSIYSIATLCIYLLILVNVLKIGNASLSELRTLFLSEISWAFFALVPSCFLYWVSFSSWLIWLSLTIGTVIYYLSILHRHKEIRKKFLLLTEDYLPKKLWIFK